VRASATTATTMFVRNYSFRDNRVEKTVMKHALASAALLVSLALLPPPVAAQTGSVRGKVVSGEGEPLADATVLIEPQGGMSGRFELQTNERGEYTQVGLQLGPYRITVSAEGYRAATASLYVALGDTSEVVDVELQRVPEEPEPQKEARILRERFTKALELSKAGRLDEAEALYKEILETRPDIPEAYENLGYLYEQKKDWPAAQSAYDKALELRPDSTEIMTALAVIYQKSGQDEKAAELMGKVVVENPEDAVAQFNRGGLLLNAGDTAGAIQAFEAALAADPELAEAHYYLGTVLVGEGRTDEARERLEQYLSMNPDREDHVATAQGLLEALEQ
jgi:tetratricopeptide (TPR) repeat protein